MNFSTAAYISNATVIIFIVPLAVLLNVAAGILPVAGLDVLPSVLLIALLDTLVAAPRYVVLQLAFGLPVVFQSVVLLLTFGFLV